MAVIAGLLMGYFYKYAAAPFRQQGESQQTFLPDNSKSFVREIGIGSLSLEIIKMGNQFLYFTQSSYPGDHFLGFKQLEMLLDLL